MIELNNGDCLDIVVVSLFDGLSGGRIALDRTPHLNVLRYYSSEIDKYAIQIANKNYPQDTPYRLGSVTDVDGYKLLKEIKDEFGDVKIMLIGGSPCQGFSMAGKLKGSSTKCGQDVVTLEQYLGLKEKYFEFDGQSYLFWEYIRIKQELSPDYFMLENVRVTKKWLPMFNEAMGVEPTRINSSLVSAQNRDRYYWHNFGDIPQPEDKGLLLRDILEDNVLNNREKSQTLLATLYKENVKSMQKRNKTGLYVTEKPQSEGTAGKGSILIGKPCELREFKEDSVCHHTATATDIKGNESIKRVYAESGKSPAVTTCQGGHREPKVMIDENMYFSDERVAKFEETLKDNPTKSKNGIIQLNQPSFSQQRVYHTDGKSPTIAAGNLGGGKEPSKIQQGARYRKLTPLECERLQTLPDGYTEGVSNSQRYKMIGNGWTIDVVAHIFSFIAKKRIENTKAEGGLF